MLYNEYDMERSKENGGEMISHRIFVEWCDPETHPDKCEYLSSLNEDFGALLIEIVERRGPPSTVEFRADNEGWVDEDGNPC